MTTGGDFTVDLFTIKYPYTPKSVEEFDPNLGRHDDFVIVGPYIFVQVRFVCLHTCLY